MKRTWKKNEKEMYEQIIAQRPLLGDLKMAEDKNSRVDCFSPTHVMELKYRNKKYDTTIIERPKYDAMEQIANGRTAIYAVSDGDNIYLFNINRLVSEGYDFQWGTLGCPTTSHFGDRRYIKKEVGYIDFDKADVVLEYKVLEDARVD